MYTVLTWQKDWERVYFDQRRDKTPAREGAGDPRTHAAQQCEGVETLPRNGAILLGHVGEAE